MIRALNTAGLSDLEKRVVKATYDDDDPPKQKHVEALILLSADHELVPYLDRRVVSPLWNVCLKSLTLVHKLSLEADERFLAELQSAPSLLSGVPAHFDTSVDPTATAHSRFIHAYAAYLQAKVRSFAALHASCERQQPADSRRWVMRLKAPALVKAVPLVQRQFDALLAVQPANSEDLNHPIPIAAMALAIKDAFRLYSVLTVMMLAVLERYESMSLAQTERMLQATRKFLAQNSKFRKWADKLCKNGFVDRKLLPKFDAIPVTFLQLLEEHIVELGGVVSEPTPSPAAKQRSPRAEAADRAAGGGRAAKRRTAGRRANEQYDDDEEEEAARDQDDEQRDEADDGAGAEQRYQQDDGHETVEAASSSARGASRAANRAKPAVGTMTGPKRSSQVRVSGVRQQQYDEQRQGQQQPEELEEAEEAEVLAGYPQRAAQPRRVGGVPGSGGGRVFQQPQQQRSSGEQRTQQGRATRQPQTVRYGLNDDGAEQLEQQQVDDSEYKQQQPRRMERSANGQANSQPARAAAASGQRRTAQAQSQPHPQSRSQPQAYDDEEAEATGDSTDVYDQQHQAHHHQHQQQQRHQQQSAPPRRPAPPASTARSAPAAPARQTQSQPQRPTQSAGSSGQQRGVRLSAHHEAAYEEDAEQQLDEEEGDDALHPEDAAAAADDPLALYIQSAPQALLASKQQSSSFPFFPPAAQSRVSNPAPPSRSAAKARVAAALSSELNLFDNFDPLTLHPAEQRALDRQQADMQAAFFTQPQPQPQLPNPSHSQQPPPAYDAEAYDTNEEGAEHDEDSSHPQHPQHPQHSQQQQHSATDLFSDLTARLSIDDSDSPPALPGPGTGRNAAAARPPAARPAVVSRSAVASNGSNRSSGISQRPTTTVRSTQQPLPRPAQPRFAAPKAYDDAADEDAGGSEPNFM